MILKPATEFLLNEDSISLFRSRFRELFGGKGVQSALYEAVSAGHMAPALEHWSALLHEEMTTLEAFCEMHLDTPLAMIFDEEARAAITARLEQIDEFYHARLQPETEDDIAYYPLAPHWHYRNAEEADDVLDSQQTHFLSAFSQDRSQQSAFDAKGRVGLSLNPIDDRPKIVQIADLITKASVSEQFMIAATSEGAAIRIKDMLHEAGAPKPRIAKF